ncbi:hypothetical protein CgunFtcFv8_015568 [Champsocephalus gunnari]|uniref:Uncharacterized protein n=1 Tax=Champsocephalus gunnari TaxID=52237 RepID=A0AAN8C966_CHAGU|nr:hypothetical protein CgunFtcFv8_015568 [Champsocephalus gunnari]
MIGLTNHEFGWMLPKGGCDISDEHVLSRRCRLSREHAGVPVYVYTFQYSPLMLLYRTHCGYRTCVTRRRGTE